jgi:SAM-dependent methyltransferase
MYNYQSYSCPICNLTNLEKIFDSTLKEDELPVIGYDYNNLDQKKTFAYYKCIDCSHVYATPRIKNMYQFYIDKQDEQYVKNSDFRRHTYSEVVKILKKFTNKNNILEYGSGMGDFIYVAEKSNFKCVGIEISKFSSQISKNLNHEVYQCDLDQLKNFIGQKKFDVIVMMGVIEHLEYPDRDLKSMDQYLNKGGLIVLWTGDFNSIYSKILKKNWWYVIGQHIQLFTRKSLKKLFQNNSYELVYNGNLPYVFYYKHLDLHLKRFFLYRNFLRFIVYFLIKKIKMIKLSLSSEILMVFKKIN